MERNITILGCGAWGTAFAHLLATNGYPVTLWCYNNEVAQSIKETRINKVYLPTIKLPDSITPVTDLSEALFQPNWIIEAIPVKFLRSVVKDCIKLVYAHTPWVILSKGIEADTFLLPSEIISAELGFTIPFVVVSGPSFALDLAEQQQTGVMVASHKISLAERFAALVSNDYFETELTNDTHGIQLCGAFKNCAALAIGLIEGAGYKDNTKALLATRAIEEMTYLTEKFGGNLETAHGLAGVGDLILTAFGSQSRNRHIGKLLGQGQKLDDILASTAQIPESINTVKAFHTFSKTYNLSLPIVSTLYAIIFEMAPTTALIESI